MTPPLEFRMHADDPRMKAAARLRVVCPHHLDDVIFEHCMNTEGRDWLENVRGFQSEMVGVPLQEVRDGVTYPMSEETRARAAFLGLQLPVEHPDALDTDQHRRIVLRCPRPTCGYDKHVRGDTYDPTAEKMLTNMIAGGIDVVTVEVESTPWRVIPA